MAAHARPVFARVGDTPLTTLPGVGPRVAEKLAARGLLTLQDLWLQLPRQYEDRTRLAPIRDLQPGVAVQVEGVVEAVERGFRYRPMLRVAIGDASRATLVMRFFHFRAAQVAQFAPGVRVRCYGTPRPGQHGLEIVHPSYRVLDSDDGGALGDQLDPVYPAIEGVGPATLRRLIGLALDRLPDDGALELLPHDWLREHHVPGLRDALLTMHRPPAEADVGALLAGTHPAQRRLAMEELLAHHLSLRRQRIALQAQAASPLRGQRLAKRLRKTLPFRLTAAQERVFAQIRDDLGRPSPMLRLVQGDVGSGKTVVAALAAMITIDSGKQAALMAPTELLAEQHLANLRAWLEPLGVRVAWLAGKVTGRARGSVLAAVASGEAQVIVGTHALMQDSVVFHDLALAIVDEQHRFGVHQRLALRDKGRAAPSAPRGRAMDGERQRSMDGYPAQEDRAVPPRGRAMNGERQRSMDGYPAQEDRAVPPRGRAMDGERQRSMDGYPAQEDRAVSPRGQAMDGERQRSMDGNSQQSPTLASPRIPHQLVMTATPIPRTLAMAAYADLDVSAIDELPPGRTPVQTVVLSAERRPELIERIRKACAEGRQAYWVCTIIDESDEVIAQAAQATFDALSNALPGARVGLVHGRMKASDKQAAMRAFKAGELDLLVATTVIEVGVDVPNASLMIVENAERLGLAQLHQLRGRVGRGSAASTCVLLYQPPLAAMARQRLETMRQTSDGFVIAEKDLELRGPGELLGTRQTGLAAFRVADLARDAGLLPAVHAIAERLLRESPAVAEQLVARWIGGAARYAGA